MKHSYRIIERTEVETTTGVCHPVKVYIPQYRVETFLGRLLGGWIKIVEYQCSSEAEAMQKIENHKVRHQVSLIENKIKYID